MHLRRLVLENFRNFRALDLEMAPGRTVLCGGNGEGKTNLLEAVFMFATARSVRATHEREVIHWDTLRDEIPFARVRGELDRATGRLTVEIVVQLSRGAPLDGGSEAEEAAHFQKRVRVNGVPRRAGDLVGEVTATLFAPEDIAMVGGPPSLRRRYLDVALSQVDRPLLRELHRYGQVLAQRNSLLKALREGRAAPDELPFWTDQLVEAGSFITVRRRDALAAIGGLALGIHRELTGGMEELEVRYLPSVRAQHPEEAEHAFRQALEALGGREMLAGASLVGPHRDDFQFLANGRDLGVYGSRGQQRTAALSVKLAEAQFLAQRGGEEPLLLLDDVFSELDDRRRAYLFSRIGVAGQALLTTSEPQSLGRLLEGSTVLEVTAGAISRQRWVPT